MLPPNPGPGRTGSRSCRTQRPRAVSASLPGPPRRAAGIPCRHRGSTRESAQRNVSVAAAPPLAWPAVVGAGLAAGAAVPAAEFVGAAVGAGGVAVQPARTRPPAATRWANFLTDKQARSWTDPNGEDRDI